MAPRNRTRLNLRIADESRRVLERTLREAPEPGERVGAFLRAWRERWGWTIDQVAWVLRIRLVYLEAIEEDRFEELPGRIYITGFVRSYAKLLGVDEEAVVRQLRREHPAVDAPRALVFPEPPAERAVPGGALMAVGIMAAIMVYGSWYYQTATSRPERASIGSVPAHLVATADLPSDSGGAARYDLPSAIPIQPPMRPPPTRTVAASPPSVATTEADMSAANTRGLPPDVGAAPSVEIALANAGRHAGEAQPDRNMNASPPAVAGPAARGQTAPDEHAPAARVAGRERNEAPSTSVAFAGNAPDGRQDQTRARATALSAVPVRREGFGPAPPQLPTAEMRDAYAARLPTDMIPLQTGDLAVQPQPVPSASAAWAGSVDGMPGGRWVQPADRPSGAPDAVVLNAVEATWIEVREGNGQVVTGKLLQPGDSYAVPSRQGLKLTTGNAGGLEVLVGGRAAPGLGPRGAVRRDISLDGGLLLAGQAVRN